MIHDLDARIAELEAKCQQLLEENESLKKRMGLEAYPIQRASTSKPVIMQEIAIVVASSAKEIPT